jgi:sphinganine C4-monooxygenase
MGAIISQSLSFMTTRQASFFFTFSNFKTVDDHCGYVFPLDPFQLMSDNNADYHDIHHQVSCRLGYPLPLADIFCQAVGIKSNFSQPFFVHWDALLGTRLTRKDIELRKAKAKKST